MVTSRAFSGRLVPETFHDWQKREGFILSQALKSFGPSFYRNQSGVEFGVSDAVVGIHSASISVLFSLITAFLRNLQLNQPNNDRTIK